MKFKRVSFDKFINDLGRGEGIILFIIFLSMSNFINKTQMYGDASNYINLGNSIVSDGKFSFNNFPLVIYRYLFPFILLILKYISKFIFNNEFIGFRVLNSVSVTLIIYVILPIFFEIYISFKRKLFGSIVISVFMVYFFGYLIYYPLSDIIGLLFFTSGVALIKRLHSNMKENINIIKIAFLAFMSGIMLYSAYNSRTI